MVAIVQPVPHVYFPCKAPAGAVVAPCNQRLPGCCGELGRCAYRDLVTGVQRKHVGGMAMVRSHLFIIFYPHTYADGSLADPDRRYLARHLDARIPNSFYSPQ